MFQANRVGLISLRKHGAKETLAFAQFIE